MQIAADQLTKVAEENWSTAARSAPEPPNFRPELVVEIYKRELGASSAHPPKLRRVMLLEISQYLENYLWPHFDASTASHAHVMSIMVRIGLQSLKRIIYRPRKPESGSQEHQTQLSPVT